MSKKGPRDAGNMLPESGFLFTEPKNDLRKHTGSTQAKSFSQESKQLPGQDWEREEESPSPLSSRGVYPLKTGGGGTNMGSLKDGVGPTNMGSRKIGFSTIGFVQLPVSVLVP